MKKYILICLFVSVFTACSDKEKLSEQSVVDRNKVLTNETELDRWIYSNFTKPYGIQVKYRWDKKTTQQGTYNFPSDLSKVKSVLEAVKFIWLETYTLPNIGGENFMKEKNPIRISMYGGKNLDSKGVELICNPNSNGVEMSIYNVNNFRQKNYDDVYTLARTLHHQFAKRLMSLIPYNRDEFLDISKIRYLDSTEDIARLKLPQNKMFQIMDSANRRGFFTLHSRFSSEDDFAEMISVTLTNSQTRLSEALIEAKTPRIDADPEVQKIYDLNAKKAFEEITQKQKIVRDYFNNKIGININRIQVISLQRINEFLNK